MGCVCGRPAAIDDSRCGETPPPAAKLSAAGVPVVKREKQARARDEAPERRRAAAMAMAACQVRSPVPSAVEAEQVTAGWPSWLISVAAEAVRGTRVCSYLPAEEETRSAKNFLIQQYAGHEGSEEAIEGAY